MTWQGGKKAGDAPAPPIAFASLRPLVTADKTDVETSLKSASQALKNYGAKMRIHVHLISGADDKVDHWTVEGGAADATVRQGKPESADVHIVMRPAILTLILTGQLAPYAALFGGKLRVGGNLEMAKGITKHLSDPAEPYYPPC
jgi:putative sterol carrier protein